MNPIESVPDQPEFGNDPFEDDDSMCCCDSALKTEIELLNSVGLVCLAEEEREAKSRAMDDLTAACRSVLSMSDIIAEDVRSDYRCAWERTSHRLCTALRMARSL